MISFHLIIFNVWQSNVIFIIRIIYVSRVLCGCVRLHIQYSKWKTNKWEANVTPNKTWASNSTHYTPIWMTRERRAHHNRHHQVQSTSVAIVLFYRTNCNQIVVRCRNREWKRERERWSEYTAFNWYLVSLGSVNDHLTWLKAHQMREQHRQLSRRQNNREPEFVRFHRKAEKCVDTTWRKTVCCFCWLCSTFLFSLWPFGVQWAFTLTFS